MKPRLDRSVPASVALVLCAACATAGVPSATPTVTVGLPDRNQLGAAPSPLAALDASSEAPAPVDEWSEVIAALAQELAQRLRWDGRKRMKVAVLDLVATHGTECSLGAPAAEDLTTTLFFTDTFEIIERRMLDRVLRENQASQSDLYDPEHAARLGGLLGADGIVTGTITASQHDYAFNMRVILAESGGVASAARKTLPRADADGRGSCGDQRQIIPAPPPAR